MIRKSVALFCVAVVVLTALIPCAAFVVTPLVRLAAAMPADDASGPQWRAGNVSVRPALRALTSSRHLPRASLLRASS
ncbi:MAG: hypothetical protein DMF59_20685 [Acidobacteria bacterium]|nr:MAG: hypothetical protein DMF59_20685 [Acidobacteriota bacterium]